jgi:3D-(3,5/4)-trihydroxycyclohexane-1,2-dione acylhydrolase (decyclizing)
VETPFVEGVATIFGHGNVLGIGQALEQDPGHLQVMQGCNEQGIAHMATGFAKQHRRQRIFAVTSSVGPGAANMVTAAANGEPYSAVAARDVYASRQPDPVLLQQFNTTLASAPTTASARSRVTGTGLTARSS